MINGKQPAFPRKFGIHSDGLSKREYFAAMALQGLLAANRHNVELAVYYADALINELNKNTNE